MSFVSDRVLIASAGLAVLSLAAIVVISTAYRPGTSHPVPDGHQLILRRPGPPVSSPANPIEPEAPLRGIDELERLLRTSKGRWVRADLPEFVYSGEEIGSGTVDDQQIDRIANALAISPAIMILVGSADQGQVDLARQRGDHLRIRLIQRGISASRISVETSAFAADRPVISLLASVP